jgi:hypothetical protein
MGLKRSKYTILMKLIFNPGGRGIKAADGRSTKNESHTNVPGTMTWLSGTAGNFEALPRRGGCVAVTTFETNAAHPIASAMQ